ncbi:MAG TPA: CatB-related O-acetyltransferase [Bacteroidales bacterium]
MKQFFWILLQRLLNTSCTIHAASLCRNVKFGRGVTIESGTHICAGSIGNHTYINKYCLVDRNTASIGNFCSIAYGVKIGLGNHPTQWVSTHPFAYDNKYGFVAQIRPFDEQTTQKCTIGNDVWIGANATILAGITVGDGAIIGANSLVTSDVEPYSIVAGTPAKHIRFRFDQQTISGLQQLKWWNWDDARIKRMVEKFDDPSKLLAEL